MKLLLNHVDSPYIRGIGFLYLRFAGEPKTIWKWIDPYLYDDEPITVTATVNKNKTQRNRQQQNETTIGDFVRRLFSSERDYYGTMLPRIPIQVERELQVKLLFAERIQDRVKKHISNRKTMDYFQTLGSRIMALYGDEENPIQWYEAVVDRVVTRNEETTRQLETPKFTVTFTEYGNTETVSLGEMEMRGVALDSVKKELPVSRGGGNHQSSQQKYDDMRGRTAQPRDRGYGRAGPSDYDRRGYTNSDSSDRRYYERGDNESRRGYAASRYDDANSRSATALPSDDDLYEEVRKRERANVTTRGNQPVARRTPSAKASLTGPHRRTVQGSSINPHPPPPRAPTYQEGTPSHSAPAPASLDSSSKSAPKKRSAEEIAAVQDKKRKLMAKYG
jgi:pre-mRNA-splicing factor 38B